MTKSTILTILFAWSAFTQTAEDSQNQPESALQEEYNRLKKEHEALQQRCRVSDVLVEQYKHSNSSLLEFIRNNFPTQDDQALLQKPAFQKPLLTNALTVAIGLLASFSLYKLNNK